MATAANTFFLLLLLLLFFSVFSTITTTAQQTSRNSNNTINIPIDSFLTPTNNTNSSSSWLSRSGRFAFGFYQQDGGFVVGIWFAGIPQKTVVWTAPVLVKQTDSNNFRLRLTGDQGLILQSTQGQDQSISNSGSTSYASMLDNGNMVLYNSNSTIIWQSFDYPTDTILQGQLLRTGASLFSKASETDYSKGRFRLDMQTDGNLVAYPAERRSQTAPYSYWSSYSSNTGDNVTVNLDEDGRLYLVNNTNGTHIKDVIPSDNKAPNGTMFYRLTIDTNGILNFYSHNLLDRNSNWTVKWTAPDDNKCGPKGLCGLNAYCILQEQKPVCRCIPGFDFIDSGRQTLGCKRVVRLESCGSEELAEQSQTTMNSIPDTRWEEDTYSNFPSTTEEECKNACLKECNCEAVMFAEQSCAKQKFPMRYGRSNLGYQVSTFIKVSTQNMNTTTSTTKPPTTTTPPTPTPTREVSKESKRSAKELKVIILAASVSFVTGVLIVLGTGFLIYRHRNSSRYKILEQGNNGLNEAISLRSFTYVELEKATDGFKEEVGRGSFGVVFKGVLPHINKLIAVKRLEKVVEEEGEREFQAEIRTIGRTHHRNLVQLLGYCHEGTNRLLVYEYMSNGSLADFLYGSKESPDWNERVQIAKHIAKGILYLHEECETQIIHCDIKPQNILMDEYRFAKIADFGLAKLLKQDQTKTYTGVRGTRGYVAPEWHRNLPVTVKVDVYSYGIVLLEIICCRRRLNMDLPEDEAILLDWVFQCFDIGELGKLVSDDKVDMGRLKRMISVALWCTQDEPSMRPSMNKVVLMLEGTIDIPIPPSPTSILSSI